MISSEDGDSILKSDFEGDEQGHGLHRVVSTINIVPHEQVVRIWGFTTDFEKLHEVMELAVDVSAHGNWTAHWLNV
jgi:hypothetical protein